MEWLFLCEYLNLSYSICETITNAYTMDNAIQRRCNEGVFNFLNTIAFDTDEIDVHIFCCGKLLISNNTNITIPLKKSKRNKVFGNICRIIV